MNQHPVKLLSLYLFLSISFASAQAPALSPYVDGNLLKQKIEYLASDALQGRNTGTEGNITAASFIATHFKNHGVKTLNGADGYYQSLPLKNLRAGNGQMILDGKKFVHGENMVFLNGAKADLKTSVVFLGFGEEASAYSSDQLKGKVVLVWQGSEDNNDRSASFRLSKSKRAWATQAGASALIEVYNMQMFWQGFRNYFSRERLDIDDSSNDNLSHAVIFYESTEEKATVRSSTGQHVEITFSGMDVQPLNAANVVGYIPGSDPNLKEEFILISAHFDHVGIKPGVTDGQDSVYNGARDNAIGTAAIMEAASYFSKNPPQRSILLAAWNAEEKGILGSRYFADNPLVPLKNIVFNMNIDNAGYNDINAVSIIGLDRTGATDEFMEAAAAVGFEVIGDPAPEQNLFDRSDNVSFAAKGIPAPSYSMGFREFDDVMKQHYHQLSDHAETLDFDYIHKYVTSYIHAIELIANRTKAPRWKDGDKYEAAAKALYGDKY